MEVDSPLPGNQGCNHLINLIRDVITACNSYDSANFGRSSSGSSKLTQVLEKLYYELNFDADQSEIFTEENLFTCDCLSALISTLDRCSNEIAYSILNVLELLTVSRNAADVMCRYRVIDSLVILIQQPELKIKTLNMLWKITYERKFTGYEEFMNPLLQNLMNNILNSDVSVVSSLGILCNISNACPFMHTYIQSHEYNTKLRRTINKLLVHDDNQIVIMSLSLLCTSYMSNDFNKLMSSSKNLDQMLKLSFNLILSVQQSCVLPYAADVLVKLLNNKHVQQFLLESTDKVESFMVKTVNLLTTCKGLHLTKILEVVTAFGSLMTLRVDLTRLMFAPIDTGSSESASDEEEVLVNVMRTAGEPIGRETSSIPALQLLTIIYETLIIDASYAASTCHLNLAFISECLKQAEHVNNKNERACELQTQKLVLTVNLILMLTQSSQFSTCLLEQLDKNMITHTIEQQLRNNPVCTNWSRHSLPTQDLHSDTSSESGVSIVNTSLLILYELGQHSEEYSSAFNNLIQKNCIIPFIGYGLSCNKTDIVQNSLKLLKISVNLLPLNILGEVLTGMNKNKTSLRYQRTDDLSNSARSNSVNETRTTSSKIFSSPRLHEDKENRLYYPQVDNNVITGTQPDTKPTSDNLTDILSSLKISSDSHVSDIISIYETKLRAQRTKENHLEDLVQAKTMALSQADRLITQYKTRINQTDNESSKLRSIVAESERRSETFKQKMNEMLLDRERLMVEVERLLEDSRRLEDTERALSSVKNELSSLTELHNTLSKHADNLKQQHRQQESDYAALKEADRKKAAQIAELTKKKKKQDEDMAGFKAEIKTLERNLKQKDEKLKVIFDQFK